MSLDEQVQALEVMDLEGLRAEWRRRFGAPPKLRSVELVRRLMAWRIQAAVYGDLDSATRRRLRKAAPARQGPVLVPGARVSREWKGVRHEVEVADGGFLYDGRRWGSLSEVARAITGVRWNGPRFFGLREAAAR